MADAKTFLQHQPEPLFARPEAPFGIFGQTVHEGADRLEHRPRGQQIGRDGKSLPFDVVPVVERENRLERLGARSGRRRLVEDVDRAAHEIGPADRALGHGQPIRRRHAVGIEEEDRRRPAFRHAAIARIGGAGKRLGDDPDEGEAGADVGKRFGRAVVHHQHIDIFAVIPLQSLQAAAKPRRIVEMGDDDNVA